LNIFLPLTYKKGGKERRFSITKTNTANKNKPSALYSSKGNLRHQSEVRVDGNE
jgi:hypothetical protein